MQGEGTMSLLKTNFYYDSVPKVNGRIRKERWGGLCYNRDKLRIDLLNEVSYYILNSCNGSRTVKEIESALLEEFDASEDLIKSDLMSFLNSGLLNGYLLIDGLEITTTRANSESSLETGQTASPPDLSFLGGKKVLGIEPNILSAPFKVLIEFTHNCNLRCIHCCANAEYCPESERGYLEGELTTDEWKIVIDKLADAEVFDIFVSGGEPLIRKDIFELMAHIKARGMGFCLLTNATLIDDEVARRLYELGCYTVEANLDGPDAESYDEFRGVKGAFEATVKGIRTCLRNGLTVRCNVTATKKNIFRLKEIIDTAWSLGLRALYAIPLEPGGRGYSNAPELEFTVEDSARLREYYDDVTDWIAQKYGNEFTLVRPTEAVLDHRENIADGPSDPTKIMPLCGAGRLHCSIGPTGHVILCSSAGKQIPITPGDVLHEDFEKIWLEADVFKEVRRAGIPGCSTCEIANCHGGCYVRRFHKYGKAAAGPDPKCRKVFLKKIAGRKLEPSTASPSALGEVKVSRVSLPLQPAL